MEDALSEQSRRAARSPAAPFTTRNNNMPLSLCQTLQLCNSLHPNFVQLNNFIQSKLHKKGRRERCKEEVVLFHFYWALKPNRERA